VMSHIPNGAGVSVVSMLDEVNTARPRGGMRGLKYGPIPIAVLSSHASALSWMSTG